MIPGKNGYDLKEERIKDEFDPFGSAPEVHRTCVICGQQEETTIDNIKLGEQIGFGDMIPGLESAIPICKKSSCFFAVEKLAKKILKEALETEGAFD